MAAPNLFGWEMLFKTIQSDVKKDSDYIIAFAHWVLVQRYNLQCVGNGKDMKLRKEDEGSELLPENWNRNQNSFALRYVLDDSVYVLLGTVSEDAIIINLLSADKLELSNVSFHTETTVKVIKDTKKTISTELHAIIERFTKELVEPVFESNKKTAETQTAPIPENHPASTFNFCDEPRSLRDDRNGRPFIGSIDPLRNVGRSDLDPFAIGGGGMLFQPPDRRFPGPDAGFPNPPGARFDPFGPPGANLRRPNNDHFRPPGGFGNDDMFM